MDSSHHTSHSNTIEITLVCSRADTDATADDLPGPGRTLDKVYTVAGRQIEHFLSKTAERLGYGPRVTARRIRRRREVVDHWFCHYEGRFCWECYCNGEGLIQSLITIKAEAKKLEKDIKCLLKYVNSKVPSTQKQAMDHILDLSVNYSDLRALLKSKGATQIVSNSVQIYSKFRFSDFDDVLLSSSRKALASLADAEINTLLQEWITVTYRGYTDEIIGKPLWNRIAPYLHDSETAFLVMRILRRTFKNEFFFFSMEYVISSVTKSPNYFEWEECDAAFHEEIDIFQFNGGEAKYLIGDWILRNADKMPRLLKSQSFQRLSMDIIEMNSYGFAQVHLLRNALMQSIISTWGNNEHTLSLDALKSRYTCPDIQSLLGAFACPLERIVIDFVGGHQKIYEYTPTSTESRVYNEISSYIDCADETLRIKAWNYVNFFLAHDIYRCDMMLQVLSATSFGTRDDFSSFMKTKRNQCVPRKREYDTTLYRHLDKNNNQIHLHDLWGYSCSCDVGGEEMKYAEDWMLAMRVERGTAFSSAGLYPLVAGYGIDGKCAYVARVAVSLFSCWECKILAYDPNYMHFAVTEGRKPEDLRIEFECLHKKALVAPESFEVLVLRYAPDAYPKALGTGEEGMDVTDPFPWKPARDEPLRTWYCANVILAEDVMAGEEMLDEAEHKLGDGGRTELGSDSDLDEIELHSRDEESEIESISQSDEAELVSCEGDEVESEREKSGLASQSCDDIPETDADLPSRDGGAEAVSMSELDECEGTARSDSEINELERNSSVEEIEDESDSPQSDEIKFSSCEGGDETGSDPKALQADQLVSPLVPDKESINLDPLTCNGRMETGTTSESDGLAIDETGGQVVTSGVRCTEGVAHFNMTVFHLAIIVVLSFALGFIFRECI